MITACFHELGVRKLKSDRSSLLDSTFTMATLQSVLSVDNILLAYVARLVHVGRIMVQRTW